MKVTSSLFTVSAFRIIISREFVQIYDILIKISACTRIILSTLINNWKFIYLFYLSKQKNLWTNLVDFQGLRGPDGDKGEAGERGESLQGNKGSQGDVGETGEPGPPGPPVPSVEPDSLNITREKGDKGDKGAEGRKGEPGIVGQPVRISFFSYILMEY